MTKRQRSSAGRPSPRRAASRGLALGVLLLGLGACNDILGTGAPRVSGVSPADGATSVPVNSSVVATLTLPGGAQLDVTTLTDTAVTLTDSSGAAVAGLRTPQGDTIVFDPTTDLAVDESYTFSVTADVKTSTNVALQPFSSSFSTGDSVAPPPGGLTADRTPVVFTAGGATSTDTRTLTLTNGGTDAVNLTGLTISGTDAAQFALADSAPSTLAPGQTRTLSLTFTPDGLGPQLAPRAPTGLVHHRDADALQGGPRGVRQACPQPGPVVVAPAGDQALRALLEPVEQVDRHPVTGVDHDVGALDQS